jgi:hypothetical protein
MNKRIVIYFLISFSACSTTTIRSLVHRINRIDIPNSTPAIAPSTCQHPDFLKQVTLGYQGWFSAKNDGISQHWNHWSTDKKTPTANNIGFELYPDVTDYQSADLFTTQLGQLTNGQSAKLFSSARDGVVKLHFQWLAEYGLDGIALQRFSSAIKQRSQHLNKVTQLVKKYAEKYCRTFYIMYDVSGSSAKNIVATIKNDWTKTMEAQLSIVDSPQYARYQHKPVIGLWGLGFNTPAHQFSQQQALTLINWFRKKGFYIVGGVPYHWRLEKLDSQKNWLTVYQHYDMLLPWSVGRYRNATELAQHYQGIWRQDLAYSKQNNLQMKRVIFPGFSWSNWNKGTRNQIPRRKGKLLWQQAYLTKQLGIGAYIAMFDEYDEATAVAKAAIDQTMIPHNQYFLTLAADGYQLSSDFYLRLSGKITQMIHKDGVINYFVPIK